MDQLAAWEYDRGRPLVLCWPAGLTRAMHSAQDLSLLVFYGPGNNSKLALGINQLKRTDQSGRLRQSILGINGEGPFGPGIAAGIGLLAACIAADDGEAAALAQAQKLLRALPANHRSLCFRHGLLLACSLRDTRLAGALLKLGAIPDVWSQPEMLMPLEIATRNEDVELVAMLLADGASPDSLLLSGLTPRILAADSDNEPLKKLFW